MKYDPEHRALVFSSQEELEEFHRELTSLMRASMVEGTRRIEDPQKAKTVSREVFKDFRAVTRTLNLLRRALPRKSF